ncbi:MAG: adenylyl-sulfate kinase [Phycisphaeraceae bacterium]|nr:adenylyl-sulfate kinase [Phycisphaeraceae bacterium]MCW5754820.1 adenylyl-sulfate kinase [Phycisphaeraceae bacterium]
MAEVKSTNIHWHDGDISRDERWNALKSKGATVWFTGLSGSGKSTVASAVEQALCNQGIFCYRLDGDNVRFGLNKNLGFSAEDRAENIRRIGEVAKLFSDAGVIALTSFISPYVKDRDLCRQIHAEAKPSALPFIEIYVDTPLEVCEQRDPKGLYKKARAGQIKGFTGIDDPYEAPVNPELVLKTAELTVQQSVGKVLDLLAQKGIITTR